MTDPWYTDDAVTVWHGDCLDVLADMADNSVDAVVTDPPYGLEFMGKDWDRFGRDTGNGYREKPRWTSDHMGKGFDKMPNHYTAGRPYQQWCQQWAEHCLRVLKPGGHLLAFGGTRTHHRLAVAIEDAGFEIRDSIAWLYGSGFPKSLDVGKAIDRAGAGAMRRAKLWHFIKAKSIDAAWLIAQGVADAKSFADWTVEDHCPSDRNWALIRDALGVTDEEEAAYEREVIGKGNAGLGTGSNGAAHAGGFKTDYDLTAPATADARRWNGWGTALKPAHEPVVVARKPLQGSVAANVLTWGTGGLNIDAARVGTGGQLQWEQPRDMGYHGGTDNGPVAATANDLGRWPPNVALEPHTAAALDQQSGTLTSGANPTRRSSDKFRDAYGEFRGQEECTPARGADSGGASRFFPVFRYEPKAPTLERPRVDGTPDASAIGRRRCARCGKQAVNVRPSSQCQCDEPEWVLAESSQATSHPTVKPLDLMRWLVRLVTPPGGLVLDPFLGSGTTAEACIVEGFRCVGVEREDTYLPMIRARLTKPIQPVLDLGEL